MITSHSGLRARQNYDYFSRYCLLMRAEITAQHNTADNTTETDSVGL